MANFEDSYLGKLRKLVGDRLLLVPGARVIVEDGDGRILLQKRSDFSLWGLPGGNAEEGEDLTSVAIREVFEETGLTVTDLRPFGFGCDPLLETITFPNGDQCQFFSLNFYTTRFMGEAAVRDDESLEVGWFGQGELPDLMENMKRSIAAYGKFKQNGEFQMI